MWERAVGVLVRPALLGRCGLAEVDDHVGRECEGAMLAHFRALVPGQCSSQFAGNVTECCNEAVTDCISCALDG